jgi:DNA-binding XRE family transcriptional regulator
MHIDLSKLRELREKAGLTRRDLADKIGCREHTIVRWKMERTRNLYHHIGKN